jgi:hypothetical protein
MKGEGLGEGHTARTWWNAMTPTERRSSITRGQPSALYAISPYLNRPWDRLPLSQMLIVQLCFYVLFRNVSGNGDALMRSE